MFDFNAAKVIEAILFFAEKEKKFNKTDIDLIKIHKYFYFSDQAHLKKYLRPIFGDTYIAMPEGPVPTMVYDILKWLRGDQNDLYMKRILDVAAQNASSSLKVYDRFRVAPLRKSNLKKFSRSELDIMNEVFQHYHTFSSFELSELSHKEHAWENAQKNGCNEMDFAEIIDNKEAWEYIEQQNKESQEFRASFQLHS